MAAHHKEKLESNSTPLSILRRGDVRVVAFFPHFFKIYIRKSLEEWKRKCHGMGISLENTTLYTLQFADGQVVLAGDKEN